MIGKTGERASWLEDMLKGTEDNIAMRGEFLHNSLLVIELVLVVGIASIKDIGKLGTVICMQMRGGLDGVIIRGCALISLDMVMPAKVQVV